MKQITTLAATSCLLVSCAPSPPPPGPTLVLEPAAAIELADGTTIAPERGRITVSYDRAAPELGSLEVEVYRFAALPETPSDSPPVFLLHGGPGFPGLGEALEREGYYEERLHPYREIADLVVVGQRGIGSSTGTPCEPPTWPPLDAAVSQEEQATAVREASRRCKEKWQAAGVHLPGLNVIEAAADVRDVALALGYDTITLWGVSFGSHWSMAVMRFHPELVERAILSGMEGPDHTYDMPGWVLNAVSQMSAAADTAPELAGLVPEGGLLEAYKGALARLEQEPVFVEVRDPESDELVTVRFDADDVRDFALGYTNRASSRTGMATWPADVLALAAGDFEGAALAAVRARSEPSFPTASFFMLDCGSGISAARGEVLRADAAAAVVGELGRFYDVACPVWESDLGEEFRQSLDTDIPTVIVHGTWDTSTPYENALELAPHFENSAFVTVEGGSHRALVEAIEASSELRSALWAFARSGDLSGLPERVVLPPMEWKIPGD